MASRVIGALLGLAALALVGLATGVVRTVLRDYGFLLERTAKGFRRRRGLLTRTDVVMPVHRVQALRVSTGILRRIWGWHGLAFISLAQDAGSANHIVAPFAQMDELAPIAAAAGLALPGADTAWERPSRRCRIDRAVIWAAIPLLCALGLVALGEPALAVLPAVLGLLLGARQLFLTQHERHALTPTELVAQTGWLSPRLTIAARAKLHSVELVQGPLARRRGYADLVLGLAGGHLRLRGLPLDAARRIRAAVLASITALDFSQLPR
jgi:putative membrane protein